MNCAADRPARGNVPTRFTLGRDDLTTLEHDPEKWMPVFRKDHAPTKKNWT